jgi:hypothetical protein
MREIKAVLLLVALLLSVLMQPVRAEELDYSENVSLEESDLKENYTYINEEEGIWEYASSDLLIRVTRHREKTEFK